VKIIEARARQAPRPLLLALTEPPADNSY